jgi:hypothetical protein
VRNHCWHRHSADVPFAVMSYLNCTGRINALGGTPTSSGLVAALLSVSLAAEQQSNADGFLRVVGNLPNDMWVPDGLGLVRDVASMGGQHYAVLADGSIRSWGYTTGSPNPEPPLRRGVPAVRISGSGQGIYGSLIAFYADGLMLGSRGSDDVVQFPSDQPFSVDGLVKVEPAFPYMWVGLFSNGDLRQIFAGRHDRTIASNVVDMASDGAMRVIYRTSEGEIKPFHWDSVDSAGCLDFVTWPPCGDFNDVFPFTSQNCLQRPAQLGSVRSMTAGRNRIIVVRPDGTAVGWGYNHVGQCEFPTILGPIDDVRCIGDGYSNLILKPDGHVEVWPKGDSSVPLNLGHVDRIANTFSGPLSGDRMVFSQTPRPTCTGDLAGYDPTNLRQAVNGEDLGVLLARWGPSGPNDLADFNQDGSVDGADLGILLNAWGPCPH